MDMRPQSRGGRGTVQLVDLLEFAIEQTKDGIAIMRFTGDAEIPMRIVYANSAIERLSGYSREELLDPTNPLLRVQAESRQRYDAYLREVRAGRPVRFEIDFHGRDRRTRCEILWSPLNYKGEEVTHYVAVLRDISERRAALAERETLYRAIEQAHDGVCIVEIPNGNPSLRRVTYANDAVCKLLRFSRDEIHARGLAGAVFMEQPELVDEFLNDIVNGRRFERDCHAYCGDGSTRWIHVTASPVYGDSGTVEQMTIAYEDIDEQKQREEQAALLESRAHRRADRASRLPIRRLPQSSDWTSAASSAGP